MDGMNSGKPSGRAPHGNPEPSRRYTGGRCRDYLRALSALDNRLRASRTHTHHWCTGEEIVHSRRKRRGQVNPLVVGSNPTGPTVYSGGVPGRPGLAETPNSDPALMVSFNPACQTCPFDSRLRLAPDIVRGYSWPHRIIRSNECCRPLIPHQRSLHISRCENSA